MKIRQNTILHQVAGKTIIVNQGNKERPTMIIAINNSARLLFNSLKDKEFSTEDVADILINQYKIEQKSAINDAIKWIDGLKAIGIIYE